MPESGTYGSVRGCRVTGIPTAITTLISGSVFGRRQHQAPPAGRNAQSSLMPIGLTMLSQNATCSRLKESPRNQS